MTVYIKEIEAVLTIDKISAWIKSNISLKPLLTVEEVETEDVVIVSKSDDCKELETLKAEIIIYEDFFEKIAGNIMRELHYNYDYYYLKNALARAKSSFINTIITGSSYGLFGIDADMLSREVNLSLISQDLFYSLKGIYEVCRENENIKNIVICCGYYYFFSDLSRTLSPQEIQRVSKVYYPIYKDMHNCMLLPAKDNILFESDVFNINNVMEKIAEDEYKNAYFHQGRERENYQTKVWADKSKLWEQLSEDEKREAGKQRALLHNKLSKRTRTLAENSRLFNEFTIFCEKKKINLVVLVMPASKYYRDNLWGGYKENFYNVLNNADGTVHLIDGFEDENFNECDFNDTDHLSKKGAEKITGFISNFLLDS